MSQILDRCFKKVSRPLKAQGNKINLNNGYNKNKFIIATTEIIMNKNICMYTYSNTVPESPSPSTSEVKNTATSSIVSLFQSDSVSDQSTDSLPPSPKQPRIEQEVSVVNVDVAYLAKRRSSLTEHEKYNFYYYHFTPDIDYKFPREGGRGFLHQYLRKYSWLGGLY